MINHASARAHASGIHRSDSASELEGEHCNGTLAGKSRWEEGPESSSRPKLVELALKISGALKAICRILLENLFSTWSKTAPGAPGVTSFKCGAEPETIWK